jgi:hypothetical protein
VKVAVSGASGFLGSALVPALEADGHEVVRLVRRPPTSAAEVEWNPEAGTVDAGRLAGVDGVVHLSGATIGRRWTRARMAEIRASRIETTRLLSETIASLDPRPAVLVCAGGIGIYGDRGDEILTEESSLGSGFAAEVGKDWEEAAGPARAAGVRVVSFRQGVVLGRGEGSFLDRLLTPFKLGLGGRIGSGRQWLSWVELGDLVEAYRAALTGELSGALNLVAPNPVKNEQLTKALGEALHRPTIVPFPAIAARTVFGQMGEEVLLGSQRALPARLLDTGFTFRYPDLGSALERALGE